MQDLYNEAYNAGQKSNDVQVAWAIAYHCNSTSPRALKWYYLARVVKVDGKWFELYREDIRPNSFDPQTHSVSNNRKEFREAALTAGYDLLHGLFHAAPSPRRGNLMVVDSPRNRE